MDQWFDGVHLLGRVTHLKTGVWLLAHHGEAAVLELPPAEHGDPDPVDLASAAATQLGVRVKFIVCTHTHGDHFARDTLKRMRTWFAGAETVLHEGFRGYAGDPPGIRYFDDAASLSVGGEPLHLVHAPKHSQTDTMVVFRGTACTGDWELGTVRTVNERVPVETRLRSCDRMIRFVRETGYRIHRVYSVHANDRREGVDWVELMAATREDRRLW